MGTHLPREQVRSQIENPVLIHLFRTYLAAQVRRKCLLDSSVVPTEIKPAKELLEEPPHLSTSARKVVKGVDGGSTDNVAASTHHVTIQEIIRRMARVPSALPAGLKRPLEERATHQ